MTDPNVMNAILALDSYNRGYDPGIDLSKFQTGIQLGEASILQTYVNGTLTTLDSGILSDKNGNRADIPAGFYAIAYNYDGSTIISYRGTDSLTGDSSQGIGSDAANG